MAIIDEPRIELERAKVVTPVEAMGVFSRPTADTGWKSWITTVDHKKIGLMYGATALFFFVVGGCEALLIRLQLARPNGTILGAETYNELFTMHGTTMVFLFIMPMAAAFSNYFIPLQIGARDVAFPRLNAFGYWCFLFGGIFLNLSWFLGGAPDGGWFAYAPNTTVGVLAVARHGLLGARPPDHGHRVADWCRQPDRHRPQHAGPGHVVDEDADLHVDGPRHPVPAALRDPGHHRRAVPAPVRPTVRGELLRGETGSRPAALAALILDIRAPRGVHPHLAQLRHRVRGAARLLAQAALRLPVRRLLGRRDRLHGLGRVGAPHVRLEHRSGLGRRVLAVDDVHRGADRREDHQLARHDVGRPPASRRSR